MGEIPQAFFFGPPPGQDDTIPGPVYLSSFQNDAPLSMNCHVQSSPLTFQTQYFFQTLHFMRLQASLEDAQQELQAFLDNPPTFHPDDCCCPEDHREQQAYPHAHTDTCAQLMSARKTLREESAGPMVRRSYNSALFGLANLLFSIAERERSTPLMQEAASYWMKYIGFAQERESFSEISSSPSNAKEIIPFVLLYLERYQEAYAFINFCFRRPEEGMREILTDDEREIALSGMFPFSTEPGACLGNHSVYHRAAYESDEGHDLSVLVALLFLLIRLRDDRAKSADLVDCLILETRQGQRLEPVASVLKEMAEGNDEFKNSQAEQIQALMDVITTKSKLILPALIRPEPLQEYMHRRHPPVYRKDYALFQMCLHQVDDALRQALAFGGEFPEYNPELDRNSTRFTQSIVFN